MAACCRKLSNSVWVFLEGGGFWRTPGLGFLNFLESFIATLEGFLACMSLCPAQASLEASLELPEETSELELESVEVSVLDESFG